MIAVSSNAAALALIHRLGADAVMRVPARIGLPGVEIAIARGDMSGHYRIDAIGSAVDLSRFFIAIDGEALLGPTFDRRMIDVLLNQTIVDRLPAHLPRPVPVAHKTADLDGYTHDAGLIYLPGRPYAIAALALGDSPAAGKVAIADLSRIAFDYFSAPN
jgi:beta-lactamase class A